MIAQYRTDYLEPRDVAGETPRILKRVMLTEWKGRHITDISRGDIRECIGSIMQRGAIAMAARAFRVIRAMFNWCVGRGLIETSPCAGLVPPPTGRPRDRVVSDDELAVVLRSAKLFSGHYGAIVMMLALTGQRRSEVDNMRWDELDRDTGIWMLPAKRTMARRSHVVHLTTEMLKLLPERGDDKLLVFSSPSGEPIQAFGLMRARHDKVSGVLGLGDTRPPPDGRQWHGGSRCCAQRG